MSMLPCVFSLMYASAGLKLPLILAVSRDDLSKLCSLFHGRKHQLFILHSCPVIGKSADIGRHGLHVGELSPALSSHRNGSEGDDIHKGISPYDIQFLLKGHKIAGSRIQVRHGKHRRYSSVSSCHGSGAYGLLIRKTGLPQMHVCICESRYDAETICIINTVEASFRIEADPA